MKIAIMGIRGIPANYGGFETFAEYLSVGLVKQGHDVTVYGRSNNIKYQDKYYQPSAQRFSERGALGTGPEADRC